MSSTIADAVKQFSLEDFSTETPYAYLSSIVGTPFDKEQAKELMSQQAKNVGFKNFIKIYNKYLASQPRSAPSCSDEYTGNYTDFVNQPLKLMCGSWNANDDGVCRTDHNGQLIYASKHPVIITAILVDVENKSIKVQLAYRIPAFGEEWQYIIVDMSVVATTRNIIALADWGIDVTSSNAGALVDYLRELRNNNGKTIPTKCCTSHLGYHDRIGFVPYAEGIQVASQQSYDKLFASIHEKGNFYEWLQTALYCRTQSVAVRIMLATAFASPLINILQVLSFIVHLWGPTGTGKSVSLALAASVYGNPDHDQYVLNHNATLVAMERTAAFLYDLPYCLDELQLAKDKDTRDMIYLLTQGSGRSRGHKTGGTDPVLHWRNCILSTGESPIASVEAGSGTVNRVINIARPTNEDLIDNPSAVIQSLLHNYGHAGKMFVELVYSEPNREYAGYHYDAFLAALSDTGVTGKQAMAAAVILTADAMATDLIFHDDRALTIEDILPYLATAHDVSVGAAALEYIKGWLTTHSRHFHPTPDNYADCYGQYTNDEVWIISKEFTRVMQEAGYNRDTVLAYLHQQGIILRREHGKGYGITRNMGGLPQSCICFLRSKLECDDLATSENS